MSISSNRRCGTCGSTGLTEAAVAYRTALKHEGKHYDLRITDLPAIRCPHCGAVSLTTASLRRIDEALLDEARLLAPAEMKAQRQRLGLSQAALAEKLRMAPESVSRWESGKRVQSGVYDLLLRLYFASDDVRSMVEMFQQGDPLVYQTQGQFLDTAGSNVMPRVLAVGYSPAWNMMPGNMLGYANLSPLSTVSVGRSAAPFFKTDDGPSVEDAGSDALAA